MDDLAKLKQDIDKLVPSPLNEARVFNNIGEMLRSLLNDVRRVSSDIGEGISDVDDVQSDLNDLIQYYQDAEIKQQRY